MLIEIVPNGLVGRHLHPGGEVGYVLEGTIEFTIGEGPPKVFRQGDTYYDSGQDRAYREGRCSRREVGRYVSWWKKTSRSVRPHPDVSAAVVAEL
jgi:hypothetical protein